MTFIAAGVSAATALGFSAAAAGGMATLGGTLAAGALSAGMAGAAGAAIGAGGAALTGGDVGKGALMGGVTGVVGGGLGAAGGALAGGAAAGSGMAAGIGAAAGAAGGAAGAAVGGEDAGKGALLGGALGGIGGYMGGVASPAGKAAGSVAGQAATSGGEAVANATGTTATGAKALGSGSGEFWKAGAGGADIGTGELGLAGLKGTTAATAPLPPAGFQGMNTSLASAAPNNMGTTLGNTGTTALNTAIPAASSTGVGLSGTTMGSGAAPDTLQKGLSLIEKNPALAMQLGGAGLTMMGGSGRQNAGAPRQGGVVEEVSPEFRRTIPLARPPQITTFADGGMIGNLPGGQGIKSMYDDTWGHVLPKGVGNTLFGNQDPAAAAPVQQPVQPQVQQPQDAIQGPMNPMVARWMRLKAEQDQQAQATQPVQATQAVQPVQATQATQPIQAAAEGGIMGVDRYSLGGYAHGSIPRLLRGEGDGVSDSIPAEIGHDGKQPARLADGEFVFPARAVSELGNGSTEAGGKILQAAVDKIQARRAKTTGKGKIAVDSKASKYLPA